MLLVNAKRDDAMLTKLDEELRLLLLAAFSLEVVVSVSPDGDVHLDPTPASKVAQGFAKGVALGFINGWRRCQEGAALTREQLQEAMHAAFAKMSDDEKSRYLISVTDLVTDLFPNLLPLRRA